MDMNHHRRFAVIAYDIPDDRRRGRVARILEGHGQRVQYSVFEVHITPERLDQLAALLRAEIDPELDHVRVYRLCQACVPRAQVIGGPEPYETPAYWIA